MFYAVYKITNLANNKIYIGAHKTSDLSDSYMGSGKLIRSAIKKYDINNFKKEYLAIFDNSEDMYVMESELVSVDFTSNGENYNIAIGGNGGWEYINSSKKNLYGKNGQSGYGKENLLRGSDLKDYLIDNNLYSSWRKNISNGIKNSFLDGRLPSFTGKTHSEQTKILIGEKNSMKQKGEKNSQYGLIWITDGVLNKKISKDNNIPKGWTKGRKIKHV